MKIESYDFGTITINNRVYFKDVIVFQNHVLNYWVREENLVLKPTDLVEVIKTAPDLLLIGTGYSGVLEIPKETRKYLKKKKIKFKPMISKEAVKKYQELTEKDPKNKIVLAIHLTS